MFEARELCLTGRRVDATEAASLRLVNRVLDTPEALLAHARQVAADIAGKSSLAVRGTKQVLNYSRDHSVADSLEYVANWNAAMLLSADIQQAVMASMSKTPARFAD